MSFRELFTRPSSAFLMSERSYDEADWLFLGIPLDMTSTFRPGSRFGPEAVRKASLALEVISLPARHDTRSISLHDAGDIHITYDMPEMLKRIGLIVSEAMRDGKRLVAVGGEHTITLGIASGLRTALGDLKVICFDAHLDMRDEFLGQRLCHATVCRRLVEELGPENVSLVGVRACSPEGLDFVREKGVQVITARDIREKGVSWALSSLKPFLTGGEPLHISLDLDVLDPAFAPAVQTPEPFGLTPWELLNLLLELAGAPLRSLDLVELAPRYDHGQTALLAARLIVELICAVGKHQA
ncbi:MAG: agmatinase [Thermoprotei archaeon]|nr:MAG: agmatinase [Thermoprotei archaeon]